LHLNKYSSTNIHMGNNEYQQLTNEELVHRYRNRTAIKGSNQIIEAGRLMDLTQIIEEFQRRNLNTDGTPITEKDLEMLRGRAERLAKADKDNLRVTGLNKIFLGSLALFIGIGMFIVSGGRGLMYGIIIIGLILFFHGIVVFLESKK